MITFREVKMKGPFKLLTNNLLNEYNSREKYKERCLIYSRERKCPSPGTIYLQYRNLYVNYNLLKLLCSC